MKLSLRNIDECAGQFLHNTLSEEDRIAIERDLARNADLMHAWQQSISLQKSLIMAGEYQRARQMIASVVAQSKSEQMHPSHEPQLMQSVMPASPKQLPFRKYLKFGSVAASVALVSSILTFVIATNTSRKNSDLQYTRLRREIADIKHTQTARKQIEDAKAREEAGADIPMPGNYVGTGFAVTNDGYVATDYHVVEGADSIFIQTSKGQYYKAFLVSFDPNSDIAMLKIENSDFRFNNNSRSLPYSLLKKRADLAQEVFSIGYPSDDPVYNEGYISAQKGYEGDDASYRLVITANPGQSGSPIFDKNGNIVAILTAKQTDATYAIHSEALIHLIQSLPKANKISAPSGNALSRLSRTDQVKKAMDYVCAVRVYK